MPPGIFSKYGRSDQMTMPARRASKFCAKRRSQCLKMFFLKLISLVIPGIREPWPECQPKESQEAPKRHPGLQRPLRVNIATPLSYNAKVPLNFQFHEGFLRVTSILTTYLQWFGLPGSVNGLGDHPRALLTTP